tara:strand:+ start:3825 stop:4025 length:201 start_codon:yes stop_codon:yes gene_type:complete
MKSDKCCQCNKTAVIVSEKNYYCAGCYLVVFRIERRLKIKYVPRRRKSLKETLETLSAGAGYIAQC